jgi:hypothetical protein
MARAGRKRKIGQRRNKNGTVDHDHSQSKVERAENMVTVAQEARQRVFGVSAASAARMPETSGLGRLRVLGATDGISWAQYEAACEYRSIVRRYHSLHPIRGYPHPGDYGPRGGDGAADADDAYVQSFRRAVDRYEDCRSALREAGAVDWRVQQVVDNVVLDGFEMPHQLGALRLGLNALAHMLRIGEREEDVDAAGKIRHLA